MQILFALLFGLLAPAQEKEPPEASLTDLIRYDAEDMQRWLSEEGRYCGPYFQWSGPPNKERIEVISFQFGNYGWKALPTIMMHQFEVHVLEGKVLPKARRVFSDNPKDSLYEVRVSQSDFDKYPCLARAGRVLYEKK